MDAKKRFLLSQRYSQPDEASKANFKRNSKVNRLKSSTINHGSRVLSQPLQRYKSLVRSSTSQVSRPNSHQSFSKVPAEIGARREFLEKPNFLNRSNQIVNKNLNQNTRNGEGGRRETYHHQVHIRSQNPNMTLKNNKATFDPSSSSLKSNSSSFKFSQKRDRSMEHTQSNSNMQASFEEWSQQWFDDKLTQSAHSQQSDADIDVSSSVLALAEKRSETVVENRITLPPTGNSSRNSTALTHMPLVAARNGAITTTLDWSDSPAKGILESILKSVGNTEALLGSIYDKLLTNKSSFEKITKLITAHTKRTAGVEQKKLEASNQSIHKFHNLEITSNEIKSKIEIVQNQLLQQEKWQQRYDKKQKRIEHEELLQQEKQKDEERHLMFREQQREERTKRQMLRCQHQGTPILAQLKRDDTEQREDKVRTDVYKTDEGYALVRYTGNIKLNESDTLLTVVYTENYSSNSCVKSTNKANLKQRIEDVSRTVHERVMVDRTAQTAEIQPYSVDSRRANLHMIHSTFNSFSNEKRNIAGCDAAPPPDRSSTNGVCREEGNMAEAVEIIVKNSKQSIASEVKGKRTSSKSTVGSGREKKKRFRSTRLQLLLNETRKYTTENELTEMKEYITRKRKGPHNGLQKRGRTTRNSREAQNFLYSCKREEKSRCDTQNEELINSPTNVRKPKRINTNKASHLSFKGKATGASTSLTGNLKLTEQQMSKKLSCKNSSISIDNFMSDPDSDEEDEPSSGSETEEGMAYEGPARKKGRDTEGKASNECVQLDESIQTRKQQTQMSYTSSTTCSSIMSQLSPCLISQPYQQRSSVMQHTKSHIGGQAHAHQDENQDNNDPFFSDIPEKNQRGEVPQKQSQITKQGVQHDTIPSSDSESSIDFFD